MRALLVESNQETRDCLHAILSDRGWHVTHASTRSEALAAFRADPFPLVLLAHSLPDGDGLELCRQIRTCTMGRAAYVVAVTTAPGADTASALLSAGVDDYLSLPLTRAQIEGRIVFAEGRLVLPDAGPNARYSTYPERLAELEQTLLVQQASLEELFQSAPEGVVVVDQNDRVVRVNGEFSRMFGYSEEEAVGRLINDLIAPEHLVHEALALTHGVRLGKRIVEETVRRHRDGTLIDVSVLATPISASEGPIGAFGIYRDISERKAHERALRESEARYRALFDQSPVGVFLCDRDLRITHCNERLTQIIGARYEEIVGTSLRDLQDSQVIPDLSEAIQGGTAFYEGQYRGPRGRARLYMSVRFAALRDAGGQVIGGMGVLEDITEREQAQQQLRAQAAELERVNAALQERTLELEASMRARSRLYTAMNHELRTPISAILLYQELLLSGTLGSLSTEQLEALERSHTATRHLLELIRDVLDLSKLEAGRISVQFAEVRLPLLLNDLHATALPLAQRYGSQLLLEVDPDQAPIETDPQRVRQILLNLLSNAAKFGRGEPVVLRCRMEADTAIIEVADRGVGIHADDLPRIFEDFVQVGSSQEGGTGLGLAISRRLATLLHGRLEVESEPGVGSTFRLVLPLSATPEGTHAPAPVSAHA